MSVVEFLVVSNFSQVGIIEHSGSIKKKSLNFMSKKSQSYEKSHKYVRIMS